MTIGMWGRLPLWLVVGVLIAIALAVFVTDGLVDVVLLVLAVGLVVASYQARRYARDELLYRKREAPAGR